MRPIKLTPEVQSAICESVAAGLDHKHAALKAGVSERTFRRWMRAGRRGEGDEFVSLLSSVKKAEAEAVAARVRQINLAAMSGTWQASAWWLERRHPDLYGSERRRVRELEKVLREVELKLKAAGW